MPRPGPVSRFFATPNGSAIGSPAAASLPAVPPSNAPSPEYRRHHDVAAPEISARAFHPGWRVTGRLLGLHEAGRIDREQLEAALIWRAWTEAIAPVHGHDWTVRVDCSLGAGGNVPFSRLDAASHLRACATALGAGRMVLLRLSVLEDVSWSKVGRALGVSDKTGVDRVVEALAALAAWFRGEPVPEPPRERPRIQPRSW